MDVETYQREFQMLEAVEKATPVSEGLKSKWTGRKERKTHVADTSPAAKTHSPVFLAATLEHHEIRPG